MDLKEAMYTRRSIRRYQNKPVPKEIVNQLLEAAIMAPSASNIQPWAFVVIQDPNALKRYSDQAKEICLSWLKDKPDPQDYQTMLADPDFHLFYNAGTLIIIYGISAILTANTDCSLAAQNLMLAARALGLGTCWIGFSTSLFDSAGFKRELDIPATYKAVAPIIVGYPEATPAEFSRNPAPVLAWRE